MKKILVALLAVVMSFGLVLAGCNNSQTHYSNGLTDFGNEVDSNGGFAVVKGDYVYFINGVASNTDDNTFGKPVTGALVRIKKSDLADAAARDKEQIKTEMVIPSLFVAGDLTSGFYMFENDDNVYFASPYTEKDREGKVQNDRLSFVRASLDGKEKNVLLTVDDNTTAYRYVKNGDKVVLLLKTTVKDETSDSDTATRAAIVAYDAKTGEKIFTSEKVVEYAFGEGTDVYFTVAPYDKQLKQTEKYNNLYRYEAGNAEAELVLSGKGNVSASDSGEKTRGIGLTGVTYSIVSNTEKYVFLKVTYVDTSVASVTTYCAYDKAGKTLVTLDEGSSVASNVFASTSYFASLNCIIYLDSTYGLVAYNYMAQGGTEFGSDTIQNKLARLFYDKDLVGYTVKFWDNGYVYLTDSNNYYYRVNVAALVDFETCAKKDGEGKLEKVNFLANSTSWYLPEVIDGKYFLSVYTASPYSSLVYVSDMDANAAIADADDADDQIEKIRANEEDSVKANLSTCISIISDSINKTIEEYIKDNFETDENK